MNERGIERIILSLSISICVFASLSVSACLSVCLSVCLSLIGLISLCDLTKLHANISTTITNNQLDKIFETFNCPSMFQS